jgi:hypothetical protein
MASSRDSTTRQSERRPDVGWRRRCCAALLWAVLSALVQGIGLWFISSKNTLLGLGQLVVPSTIGLEFRQWIAIASGIDGAVIGGILGFLFGLWVETRIARRVWLLVLTSLVVILILGVLQPATYVPSDLTKERLHLVK